MERALRLGRFNLLDQIPSIDLESKTSTKLSRRDELVETRAPSPLYEILWRYGRRAISLVSCLHEVLLQLMIIIL